MRCWVPFSLLIVSITSVQATEVRDDFESGENPNNWSWISGSPGMIIHNGGINPVGGNPGAWFDSTDIYLSDHPNFTAVPDLGTPLRAALESGQLRNVQLDIQRLDASNPACPRRVEGSGDFVLRLFDLHTVPHEIIEAQTHGIAVPPGYSFPWLRMSFSIPSSSTGTPAGWDLLVPTELSDYGWAEMMRNIDGISVFVVDPEPLTVDGCWWLGADNVVVTYGDVPDAIFANGFDSAP